MKNYICTGKGFVQGTRFDPDTLETEILYTDKVREAQAFNTKAALKFIENKGIEGFVWKPNAQDAIRNMYTVKKIHKYDFQYNDDEKKDSIQEWQPVKLTMTSDSDIGFLMSGKLKSEEAMTFEEAKAEALKLNTEILSELMGKIDNLKTKTENDR